MRMRVFSNLAISLDGKIADLAAPARPLGTPFDRKMMQKIRNEAEVVVMGAQTLRVLNRGVKALNKKKRYLVNAVITRSGAIDPDAAFWRDPKIIRFIFTTTRAYTKALESARDRAFLVVAGDEDVDPHIVLRTLKAAGFTQILVEGGGELMRSFVQAKALDELFVTLTPHLLGGRNPSLIGGDTTLKPWAKLKLLRQRKVKDEIYLHYSVK